MIAKLLILVAKGWQKGPSMLLPPSCRYSPSCSAYAITALQRYGALAAAGWPQAPASMPPLGGTWL
jgi:putative component of membrane protein insertase Oxa1/YidC/SpoIIIJ protein YidD